MGSEFSHFVESSMLDARLAHTEFASWYPKYKKHVPKVRILEAPEEFREYLCADGIALHEDISSSDDSDWESPEVSSKQALSGAESESDHPDLVSPPKEFHLAVEQAIKDLNGKVAPKLNWSSPVDAKWMSLTNSLCCTSANEVYMLLKSSDYVNHDLQLHPNKITLVLREWFDLHPSTEFRCFVRERKLIGISQRDMNFYEFLEPARKTIEKLCHELALKLSATFEDDSFVFDVHVPASQKKAWLIDINPWDPQTDPLLFSWEELVGLTVMETRLVERQDRSRTFSSKPHTENHVPYDFVDMDRASLEDMLRQLKEQRRSEQKEV